MKKLLLSSLALGCGVAAFGQSAIDAFRFAAPDMKGTARFMSMGGAFGALETSPRFRRILPASEYTVPTNSDSR